MYLFMYVCMYVCNVWCFYLCVDIYGACLRSCTTCKGSCRNNKLVVWWVVI